MAPLASGLAKAWALNRRHQSCQSGKSSTQRFWTKKVILSVGLSLSAPFFWDWASSFFKKILHLPWVGKRLGDGL
jgi:hypothetical protein